MYVTEDFPEDIPPPTACTSSARISWRNQINLILTKFQFIKPGTYTSDESPRI